jgi:hypothetical protein
MIPESTRGRARDHQTSPASDLQLPGGPIMKTSLSSLVSRLSTSKPEPSAFDHDAEVDSRFESNTAANMFRGVFDTWEAAAASAPHNRPLGYDNPDSAALYLRHLSVDDWDYPPCSGSRNR